MGSDTTSVDEYLERLPGERRLALEIVRAVVLENLPMGIVESLSRGMISYEVASERYPGTTHGKRLVYAALASQKRHMAVYLHGIYADERLRAQFIADYTRSGKRLDTGAACVRFRKLADLPLDVVGRALSSTSAQGFIRSVDPAYRAG